MALSSGLLLDTHTWLWQQNKELRQPEKLRRRMEEAALANLIFISSFSFYELANALRKQRIILQTTPEAWFRNAFAGRSVRVLDLTPAISLAAMQLPASFHGDPGDRIIAATAITENLTLLTHDKALLGFGKQGVLKVLKVDQIRKKNVP